MATFIEESIEDPNEVNVDGIQEETQVEQQQQEVEQPQEDDLPEKYKGKDLKEIVRMHQEAEKLIGRQGSEVGELRKLVDDFIKAQATNKQQPQVEVNEDDFFADPKKAVEKVIENHPKIRQAEAITAQMTKERALQALKAKHSDYTDVVQDPNFLSWIQASKVRTELLIRADRQLDYEAADELLTLYKERKQTASSAVEAEKQARSKQIKSATTSVSGVSDEAPSAKIYRRADIIKLMQTDPDRYDLMQPELMKAYAEGRVK
jgi:predicted RNA-binding protein YlqC (UPF0109 family)